MRTFGKEELCDIYSIDIMYHARIYRALSFYVVMGNYMSPICM